MAVLLQALQRSGCRHLSRSSSSTVYGPQGGYGDAEVTEDAVPAPQLVTWLPNLLLGP